MKLGAVILRCDPFAHVVSDPLHTTVCDGCFKRSTKKSFQRCSGCKYIHYCGSTCQRASWPSHRDECKYLKSVAPKVPTDTVRLMARIILKLKAGDSTETSELPDGSKRCFEDLMTHQKEILDDSARFEAFNSFFGVLQDCFGANLPPKSEVLDIYGKILINSFNIMDDEYQTLGIGLYLSASVLDHSCRPNAQVVFNGKSLIVRCIEENFQGDLSQVRISYTNLINTNATRRKDLMDQYYFQCNCPACENDQSEENLLKSGAILCPKCSKSVPVNSLTVTCPHCNGDINAAIYDEYFRLKTNVLENSAGHPDPLKLCSEFYPVLSKIFSPYDRSFIEILEQLYEDSVSKEEWQIALDVGTKLLTAYKRLYPVYDVNTALLLMKLGKISCLLNLMPEAEKHLEAASKIIRYSHGPGHPLYSEVLDPLLNEIQIQLKAVNDISSSLQISKSG